MTIKKWGIYRANLDPVVGSEQGKSRPVLVISEDAINDVLSIVNVLPIMSRKHGRRVYPNEALLPPEQHWLPNESIVLCHQIRTLDKQRLSSFYGSVQAPTVRLAIMDALRFQLGM